MNRGELRKLEASLRSSVISLSKSGIAGLTIIEVVDDASIWPQGFDEFCLRSTDVDLNFLMENTPLLVCAISSEVGFRFEGVGTVFWAHFDQVVGCSASMVQRQQIADSFRVQADRFNLSHPAQSAFSEHFSNIAWPIANALLPCDLIGPVTRLLSRAPVGSLPGSGRSTNFPSLRAWASATEGARLVDWLRLEAPSARVLASLLTENRGNALSPTSYTRLRDSIAKQADAFFATRAARLRAQAANAPVPAQSTPGQFALTRDSSGLRMFVTWPPLPVSLYEEARITARGAGWRARLWNGGAFLHPDTALGPGPFALTFNTVPPEGETAYPDAAKTFGEHSQMTAALTARTITWSSILLFDPNEDRSRAQQRFEKLAETAGYVWIASKSSDSSLEGLRSLGHVCGYVVFEADLGAPNDRALLTRAGLYSTEQRLLVARHPIDAITAPHGIVRINRPFVLYVAGGNMENRTEPQRLGSGERLLPGVPGRPALRAEPAAPNVISPVELALFERDNLFEALIERRLQLRVESQFPLTNLPIVAELEIAGQLVARGRSILPSIPVTPSADSNLFAPLYEDRTRSRLLESGRASLRIAVNRSATEHVQLQRPAATVETPEAAVSRTARTALF